LCLQCFDAVGWAAGRASGLKKTEWWGAGVVICLERRADLHIAQLMPLPLTVSCFNKIQIGFTFLVPAQPGSPRKRAIKRVCVGVLLFQSFRGTVCSSVHFMDELGLFFSSQFSSIACLRRDLLLVNGIRGFSLAGCLSITQPLLILQLLQYLL